MTQYFSSLRSLVTGSALLVLLTPTAQAAEQLTAPPSVDAHVWVPMGYTSSKVLAKGSADEKLDPASPIRIMTSYMVGQVPKTEKTGLSGMVTVGKNTWTAGNPALRGSSIVFFKPGDQVAVSDLNKGVIIQPGNDVYIILADYVVGSQKSFIGLMSGYAKKLGLTNIIFQMVHGLDTAGQFSTAHDMVLLGKALIHDVPKEYAIRKEKEFTFNEICRPSRSRLLWSTNLNVDDMKTGTTAGAGYSLMASAIQGDTRLISMVLGAKTDRTRFNEPERLLTWSFRFFGTATPIESDATFVTRRVWFGDESEVNLDAEGRGPVAIPRGQLKNLKASFTLIEPQLAALLGKDQIVGTIDFQLNGKSIEQRSLMVTEDVEEGGFFSRMWDFIMVKFYQRFGDWSS